MINAYLPLQKAPGLTAQQMLAGTMGIALQSPEVTLFPPPLPMCKMASWDPLSTRAAQSHVLIPATQPH